MFNQCLVLSLKHVIYKEFGDRKWPYSELLCWTNFVVSIVNESSIQNTTTIAVYGPGIDKAGVTDSLPAIRIWLARSYSAARGWSEIAEKIVIMYI